MHIPNKWLKVVLNMYIIYVSSLQLSGTSLWLEWVTRVLGT